MRKNQIRMNTQKSRSGPRTKKDSLYLHCSIFCLASFWFFNIYFYLSYANKSKIFQLFKDTWYVSFILSIFQTFSFIFQLQNLLTVIWIHFRVHSNWIPEFHFILNLFIVLWIQIIWFYCNFTVKPANILTIGQNWDIPSSDWVHIWSILIDILTNT